MFDVIQSVIGADVAVDPGLITSICGAVACILIVVVVDFIKEIFFGFFRG